jgi:acyl dehydratase
MATEGLLQGRITDESLELMRKRIGYPNPTVRSGILKDPWNTTATQEAFRRFAISNGDDNPLYIDPSYPARTRWGQPIAPTGFEMSMGVQRHPKIPDALDRETRAALKGVQLFHSGGENYYYAPIREGVKLYVSRWVQGVEDKQSRFAGRSAIVTNGKSFWDDNDEVFVDGVEWFIHAERHRAPSGETAEKESAALYTEEQLAEVETAYENEYRRGRDTLYVEDVKAGDRLPRMAKGPLTITDLINSHMGCGWFSYGNPPYRLAYENRKRLRGFYTKNEFNAWDTLQRVHWDKALANEVGVLSTYDIGPMREAMLAHYCNNYAGDDGWVYRLRYEFRSFNFMGDTTWIDGVITDARMDETLGPLIEIDLKGVNQRGKENIRGSATILVASRKTGLAALPPSGRPPKHRS